MVSFFSRLNHRFPKRVFDATSKEDLVAYKNYLANNSWGSNGCPFELEWPHLSVPDMIAKKVAESVVAKV